MPAGLMIRTMHVSANASRTRACAFQVSSDCLLRHYLPPFAADYDAPTEPSCFWTVKKINQSDLTLRKHGWLRGAAVLAVNKHCAATCHGTTAHTPAPPSGK